jgi:hypothetical protein
MPISPRSIRAGTFNDAENARSKISKVNVRRRYKISRKTQNEAQSDRLLTRLPLPQCWKFTASSIKSYAPRQKLRNKIEKIFLSQGDPSCLLNLMQNLL